MKGVASGFCSRPELQPHAGDARAGRGLVADEFEGEADQNLREGRQPQALCRPSNGGSSDPLKLLRPHSTVHRRVASAGGHGVAVFDVRTATHWPSLACL